MRRPTTHAQVHLGFRKTIVLTMGLLMLCQCLHPCLKIMSQRVGVLTGRPWSGFKMGRSFLIGGKLPPPLLHIGVIIPL